jgi:hypothetical protein
MDSNRERYFASLAGKACLLGWGGDWAADGPCPLACIAASCCSRSATLRRRMSASVSDMLPIRELPAESCGRPLVFSPLLGVLDQPLIGIGVLNHNPGRDR